MRHRMEWLVLLIALSATVGLVTVVKTQASSKEDPPLKALVHINFGEPERHGQGLRNIKNILREVGDQGILIEVVCHSSGIGLLEKDRTEYTEEVSTLLGRGVQFVACENTMRKKDLQLEDLIPGVETVPSGAVEIIRRQHSGYAYFRP